MKASPLKPEKNAGCVASHTNQYFKQWESTDSAKAASTFIPSAMLWCQGLRCRLGVHGSLQGSIVQGNLGPATENWESTKCLVHLGF